MRRPQGLLGRGHVCEPAVREPRRAAERGLGAPADPDGWPGLLDRPGRDRDVREAVEPALERHARLGPEPQDDLEFTEAKVARRQPMPEPSPLEMPADRARRGATSFEGGRASLLLPATLLERLRALAAREEATLYMMLLAAFQTVLHRWSGQDDLITGSAIGGRTRAETEGIVGYFSPALPLRTRFLPDDSFRSLLRRIRTTVLGTLEYQDVPIEAVVIQSTRVEP